MLHSLLSLVLQVFLTSARARKAMMNSTPPDGDSRNDVTPNAPKPRYVLTNLCLSIVVTDIRHRRTRNGFEEKPASSQTKSPSPQ